VKLRIFSRELGWSLIIEDTVEPSASPRN